MERTVIRRATPRDAATLADIGARTFVDTFGHLYPPEDLAEFLAASHSAEAAARDLADPHKAVWLVEADGAAIGYALAGPCDLPHPDVTPRCGELKRLYLLGDRQGGGLGGRLLAEAMSWLQADGPRTIWIGVWSENHGAQRLYARQGFERVGEYGFQVGGTVDREFILKRSAESFAHGQAVPGNL